MAPGGELAGKRGHDRIVAQMVVVVEVLVAERDADDTLNDQGFDLVLDHVGCRASVKQAARRRVSPSPGWQHPAAGRPRRT